MQDDDHDDFDEYDDEDEEEDDFDFDDKLGDDEFSDEFGDLDGLAPMLDDHETALIRQDLHDLDGFEATFKAEGYRGVAVFCQDCAEDHFYPWEMLRENLQTLLETGETPVHEPAFAPDPEEYINWEYAKGYVDALTDSGAFSRLPLGTCRRCRLELPAELAHANFCPRCGAAMLPQRLVAALEDAGLSDEQIDEVLARAGIPR